MWILVLILSIKLSMPTWYWIIFTVITIIKPFFITPFSVGFWNKWYENRKNK